MQKKVKVGVSNHHVHLTQETYYKLFGKKHLTLKNYLHQVGEFAAEETLSIQCGDKKLENLRIIGPFRKYNQIEISATDARKLRINPPVRKSGDVKSSIGATLCGPQSNVKISEGIILAQRHIHFSIQDAQENNIEDNQTLYVKVNNQRSGLMEVKAKVSENGFYELHIDTDEAGTFLLNNGDEVEVVDKL